MLVIDSSFTYEAITQRGLQESVTCRDLNGFFEHVWTVHPFASLLTSPGWAFRYGEAQTYEVDDRHTFVEGKVGLSRRLAWLFPVNFFLGQVRLYIWLRRLVKEQKVSVIRAGDPLYLALLGLAVARSTGVPLLVRVGSNNDKIYETTGKPIVPRLMRWRWVEKLVERFVLSRADLVAGANQDNLDFALANGARPEASTLFRYGNLLDKRHFLPPSERHIDRNAVEKLGLKAGQFLLYIGRLEAVKHPDDVVRTLAYVRGHGHDVKAVLAGDGRLREQLTVLAEQLGVADHLVMPGNCSQDWLVDAIGLAAVVVSPHTGRALSEAALGAAPVVAYDVDWQAELIETGLTGMLVPHNDVAAMGVATAAMLADSTAARMLGDNLRSRALEMLDPEKLDQHERDHYSTLIGRRS
ncbi:MULTISPECIES: glycosyltransferase [unclassified Sphingomonas]|uniref:glycosyltransferase n=1 Tax=unclassified Sphingomonas TaxID=196159 RepID=UPI00226B228A|nr:MULTISPECIES: glycosyltransferase [unclassified Sphingomonas]